ncbi:TetR/AcrR family transcriptional regulator [Actinomycetes bacterium KLBMP 9797]
MSRMTRAQQQERTHDQLLDGGRAVFLRRGFLAATVEEIAAEAGYTRGAIYKHFGGKEGLWQAVVAVRVDEHLERLRSALDRAGGHGELLAALDPSAVLVDSDAARWTAASVEFLAAVAGDPRHADPVAAVQRRFDEELVRLLTRHCARLGIRPALPLPRLVTALDALFGGLAVRRAVDPTIDAATIAADMLALVLPPPDPSP